MEISELQQRVDEWIKTYGVRYFSELTNMAVLTEEVGELARIMARRYGDQSAKSGEECSEERMAEEMADGRGSHRGHRGVICQEDFARRHASHAESETARAKMIPQPTRNYINLQMKRISTLLAALLIVTAASAQTTGFNDNRIIAHRGAWKNTGHPQNSLASFRAAAEMGCHGSECDVHLTSDDSLVVYHDLKHGGMLIEATPYAELAKVPLKNGETIPTLRQYIARAMKQHGTKLIIDIKTPREAARATDIALAADKLVKQMGADEWVEYLAGYLPAIDALRRVTDLPVAYLGRWRDEVPEMNPDTVKRRGIKYIDYEDRHYLAHPEWVDALRRQGVHLNAWIVNDEERMDWFIERDFDYITTDEPEKLFEKYAAKAGK